ncbi:MAG: ABC transporter ATP-binding protein [Bacteroidota bacterium]
MKALQVRGLTKRYGDKIPVDGLEFSVEKGDIYGFLGTNGAGKSTTIRMLTGLVRPDSGTVELLGNDFSKDRQRCLSKIGAIVEKPDFYNYLSASENLDIFGKISGVKNLKSRISDVIDLVGLSGRQNDRVKTYSHGMKQRLGLAQALLHDPELIILDEPTTGLDPQGIVDLRQLVLRLRDNGKTVFMSSHILHEVELVATRMVIISKGKAIAEGSVSELLHSDDLVVRFEFDDIVVANASISTSGWESRRVSTEGSTAVFRLKHHEVADFNRWCVEKGLRISGINSLRRLEEYFMRLTG